ncbi:MAG: DNA sulfur modification protein DndD [Persicimonas sp.]
MLLKRLVLENFGVYAGRHELQLEPAAADKPVVLVGGLNGAGKTTLLDAFRLVLYGKRAQLAERDQSTYDGYLRDAIHREANPMEGASIELEFNHHSLGRAEQVRLVRKWSAMGDKVYEKLQVFRDGELDEGAGDGWAAEFEQIMPLALSELFFFDGERVRRFTESAETATLLTTAMTHLMGLGLVDQLADDLKVVERKTRQSFSDEHDDDQLREAQRTLESAREELAEVNGQLEQARRSAAQLRTFFDRVDAQYRRQGGDEYESRTLTEAELDEVDKARRRNEDELRAQGARMGPLELVGELLEATCEQAEAEVAYNRHLLVRDTLGRRDRRLVDHLDARGVDEASIDEVRRFLREDIRAREQASAPVEPFLDVGPQVAAALCNLVDHSLPRTRRQIDALLAERATQEQRADKLQKRLSRVPDEAAIKDIFEKRQSAKKRLDRGELTVRQLEESRQRIVGAIEHKEKRLDSLLRDRVASKFEAEDSARVLIFSNRLKAGLSQFRDSILERNLVKLERQVVNVFRRLARKDDLVADLHIDPQSFELVLVDRAGKRFSPDALSAGERQVLSISMLWGLAKNSQRLLPTIIDTPLGRLDSEHRKRLVTEYFPNAGHQVILLSTDEEVVGDYLELLEPSISRCYRLDFEADTQATHIDPGYFEPC